MSRFLQVTGAEIFRIEIPEDAKVYLGPLVPAKDNPLPEGVKITNLYMQNHESYREAASNYALHVEDAAGLKLACIPNVKGFRDLGINYTEKIATEEGASMWKSDQQGYKREENVRRTEDWVGDKDTPALPKPTNGRKKR